MERRRYLGLVAAAASATLAGCASGLGAAPTASRARQVDGTAGDTRTPSPRRAAAGADLPVPESDLTRAVSRDAIPAIVDPVFGRDWSGVTVDTHDAYGYPVTTEPRLSPDDRVIGVEREGRARAYPLKVLRKHEIVNDDFAGPLLVTYCPLCGSGVTAERRVRGQATVFGVSGKLWHSDLVMYDRLTESLWSQLTAGAIRGPATGETLAFVPSTLSTWGAWRDAHPETRVLRPPPESDTVTAVNGAPYDVNYYGGYSKSSRIGVGANENQDDRLPAKARVLGLRHGGVARAYPKDAVRTAGPINDWVGGLPVVVALDPSDTLVAYDRRVHGRPRTFRAAGPAHLRAGGSRWDRVTGRAVDGPHAGTTLARANDVSPLFWFAWSDFNPDTEVFRA